MKQPISIFDYFDYRSYLDSYYIARKAIDSKFSYRYFAMKAGYNSSGLYSSIVQGKVNLTTNTAVKFSKALALNDNENKYFLLMIEFTHAQNPQAKQNIFEEMLPYLPLKSQHLQNEQKDYYSKWYYTGIHQALDVLDIKDDLQELCAFLSPNISLEQAQAGVQTLKNLQLIKFNDDGFWKSSQQSILGGSSVGQLYIHDFQREMIELGKESLQRYSKEKRHVSTMTLSLSYEGKERILHKLALLQKELNDIALSDQKEEQIFQCNLQFFPLTNRKS